MLLLHTFSFTIFRVAFWCTQQVLTLFAGALLENQIVFVCSNLGILSASVLSLIPLIRPYQWQSLLMPVLPNDMLDFLEAPVPYIVGVQNKTSEVQSKLTNAILVDVSNNQVHLMLYHFHLSPVPVCNCHDTEQRLISL